MTSMRLRDYQPADMDAVLRLWDEVRTEGVEPVYALAEVLASCEKDYAVVAADGDRVLGVAVARAAHDQGWIVFLAVTAPARGSGIAGKLLAALEQRMAPSGLTKLSILVPDEQQQIGALTRAGFADRAHLSYFEREIPVKQRELAVLRDLGGRILPRDLWGSIAGMQTEKELLERRLVLPLADPGLADQFGVQAPRSIVLFGPPGTGKTTFAKAVASRLQWPFVEVFPSRLAHGPQGLAGGLRETFTRIAELDHVIVFIDEVEEIAGQRGGEPPSAMQGVTNELLKIIPAFRDSPGRLLICATNFIRALDAAFLRHGRFDYVIPIGLPDAAAREAIWGRYIPEQAAESIDLAQLVARTDGYSPADIEFAARSASQAALEQSVFGVSSVEWADGPAGALTGPSTADYLAAIDRTRATVSSTEAFEFREDIAALART
ncbi:GNAT family N-acetyltransferase [Microcella daejeonensis]|uniref:ATP-binding protein n=1 Tax=Microcella daejeonensis TaxID=2994971 RepID=UPI00226E98FE|nr:GNAT family N-acetyltransferase [Microcella daejeonensis]WAB84434.1 GNAT family N-acetyltransferase [Microcella daejeonensis]